MNVRLVLPIIDMYFHPFANYSYHNLNQNHKSYLELDLFESFQTDQT